MKAHQLILSIVLIAMIAVLTNCKKENNQTNGVPDVDVNFSIRLTDPEFIKLTTIGNWEYITGGSRGIVIYRVSDKEFVVFDRHCPYDPEKTCSQLDVDVTGLRVNDYDCCGSEYSLINGTVLKGPSTFSLKKYNTSFDGNILLVNN